MAAVDRVGTAFAADSMVAADTVTAAHLGDIEAIPILDLEDTRLEAAVIYPINLAVSQETCHAAKRFQRMGFLA